MATYPCVTLWILTLLQDSTRVDAGQALGALCSCLPEEEAEVVLEAILRVPGDKGCLQAHVAAVSQALETALDRMVILGLTGSVGPVVMAAMTSEQVQCVGHVEGRLVWPLEVCCILW